MTYMESVICIICKCHLPARWWVVDEIPRTSRGKINREAVKAACVDQPALDLVRILGAGTTP